MTESAKSAKPAKPGHAEVLAAAVEGIHGAARPGQIAMADAIAEAFANGRQLLVQAGTGTGKSLGYLTPALMELTEHPRDRIIVATATLALQSQLANNDIPAALDAVYRVTGKRPSHAILKGRTNYACLLKVKDGVPEDQDTLIDAEDLADTLRTSAAAPESVLGAEVLALREWAESELEADGIADRDDAPTHTEKGWQQVSMPVRECLGVQNCPVGDNCFVEKSRNIARSSDLVVTNHALLAIDAMHGGTALPEHSKVIIDEAHELVARVTRAASKELSPQLIERVGRRAMNWLDDDVALELLESADALRKGLDDAPLERIEDPDSALGQALAVVRAATRTAVTALSGESDKDEAPERKQVAAAVKEIFDIAERMAAFKEHDVVWVADRDRFGREARVAPLSVAGLLRDRIFAEKTVVLTSATLKLGGNFAGVGNSLGLKADEQDDSPLFVREPEEGEVWWRGLDVGSPFDYRRQGILYVARSMPPPGRDGLGEEFLAEIAELVWASGGRTLGLFSSRRAAEAAAIYVRKQLPKMTILCQGDAQLSELTRRFISEESASLFGTLSLWQGVDVPGATCQLVIIDRIPFPRPDEPLTMARQRAVAESGGNGFMAVAATHAALLLAQGSGRLIRRMSDKGVVAVLDSRLATARYGSFLKASMPPMWETADRETVIGALRRLAEERPAKS